MLNTYRKESFTTFLLEIEKSLNEIAQDAKRRRSEDQRLHPNFAINWIKQEKIGAIRLPKELGGLAVSLKELFQLIIRIAKADPDVAHILRSHFLFVEETLALPPSEIRTKRLEIISAGNIVGNATNEQTSNTQGSKVFETRLERRDQYYVLNGTKYFTTGTLYSDWVSVLASNNDGDLFIAFIPTNREGVEVIDDWDGFGQKLTGSGTTKFHNVKVQVEEVQELKNSKLKYASIRQLYLHGVIAGIVKEIVEDSVSLIRSRKRSYSHASTEKAKDDPQLLQVIGEISSIAHTLEILVLNAAEQLDKANEVRHNADLYSEASHKAAIQCAQVKIIADQLALRASTILFDVGGATATKGSIHLDRHWRNIRTIVSHNPASYKSKDIGNWLVNGLELPTNGYY